VEDMGREVDLEVTGQEKEGAEQDDKGMEG
jgi:hypothetical protein